MNAAIETRELRKTYTGQGGDVVALDGLDLRVEQGECFGLLGPNGAGKSTTIDVLTTRVRPTGGMATVFGTDVAQNPVRVRLDIGVVPQRPNPDRSLTVRENLVFHALYFGISAHEAGVRADKQLRQFGLESTGARKPDALSGGQLQRLMIARALMHEPKLLFLDEPTVGLDPQSRLAFWDVLRELRADGRTLVLTTHYMEEADRLCERIAIVDRGKLLACDTPSALKAKAPGSTLIELQLSGQAETVRLALLNGRAETLRAEAMGNVLRVYADRVGEVLPELLAAASDAEAAVADIRLFPPSLETLFVSLTGRKLS
jgi:ABC-2 type transport system ATP-binding protein